MKAERSLQRRAASASRTVIALALAGCLAACSKGESAVASGEKNASAPPRSAPAPVSTPTPVGTPEKPAAPGPDEALGATVKSKLAEAGLASLAVEIVSANGAVTLYGTADSKETRDKAARVASSVAGVTSVANEIVIVRGS